MAPRSVLVGTPVGSARLLVHPAATRVRRATVVLGHGAGRGADSPDLVALAARLPRDGVEVVLVEQPWVLAGRRVAAPARQLDLAWAAALEALADAVGHGGDGPVVWGGRSAGARVAARTSCGAAAPPDALLLLAFPLHPPGRPGADRSGELLAPAGCGLPVVVLQGGRDPFGTPDAVRAAAAAAAACEAAPVVRDVPGAGHGLAVAASGPITAAEAEDLLVAAALEAVALGSRARRSRGARVGPAPVAPAGNAPVATRR